MLPFPLGCSLLAEVSHLARLTLFTVKDKDKVRHTYKADVQLN